MASEVPDAPEPWRPALGKLTADVREHLTELAAGLESERRVLEWFQAMTVRTLGTLGTLEDTETDPVAGLARGFRGEQTVFVASLLRPAARTRAVDDDGAESVRRRFLTVHVLPAYQQAFRELRTDATEYVDGGGEGDAHDPERQRHIAMRPSLDEIDAWQQRALARLLDGFEDTDDVIDWTPDLVQATHGELGREWTRRCVAERSTVRVLTGDGHEHEVARRLFAAYHLLPVFRDGVRVLWGRSGEVADSDAEDSEVPMA